MGVEAAVSGDPLLLKQAMLHDPMISAVCTAARHEDDGGTVGSRSSWLPQYKNGI